MVMLRSAIEEVTFNVSAPTIIYVYGIILLIDSLYKAQNQTLLMYITNDQ